MKKILVTGALGYIGSHVSLELLKNEYDVVAIDSLVNSSKDNLKLIKEINNKSINFNKGKIEFFKGDIRDAFFLDKVFSDSINNNKPIQAVIHLAGLKAVNESLELPISYWDVNVNGTINLLKIMNQNDCRKIVFSSSATIYKPSLNKLLKEDSEIGPINVYGKTKLTNEIILKDIYDAKKNYWSIINLRYFNPVGAHSSGLIGEDPKGIPNNLFPILIKVAAKKLEKLKIFGNNWPTPDGTCIRDYIHIMDLAEAHKSALSKLFDTKENFLNLNIGTGLGTSVMEFVEMFKKVNNCTLPYEFVERRQGDAPFVVADNYQALNYLNWTPSRNIEQICIDGWNYVNKKYK